MTKLRWGRRGRFPDRELPKPGCRSPKAGSSLEHPFVESPCSLGLRWNPVRPSESPRVQNARSSIRQPSACATDLRRRRCGQVPKQMAQRACRFPKAQRGDLDALTSNSRRHPKRSECRCLARRYLTRHTPVFKSHLYHVFRLFFVGLASSVFWCTVS